MVVPWRHQDTPYRVWHDLCVNIGSTSCSGASAKADEQPTLEMRLTLEIHLLTALKLWGHTASSLASNTASTAWHETAWRAEWEFLVEPVCPTTRIRECQDLVPSASEHSESGTRL